MNIHATRSAVVTDAGHVDVVVDSRLVVHVVNYCRIDICYASVVIEVAASPVPAVVTAARIAVPIINAAVVADLRSPVALVPVVGVILKGPVARSPQQADLGWEDPRSGNPIVASIFVIRPVAGDPHVAGAGAKRLLVHGQNWWPEPDDNFYAARWSRIGIGFCGRGEGR